MQGKTQARNSMLEVLSFRDFRLLFFGSTTSILGDQFAFIAMPWLVLQLTHDPLALGFVLALGGVPRAVFILLGGAISDRLSPRVLLFTADIIRLCLTAWMALVVFTGTVQMWMLYFFCLGFGVVAGFAVPAANSLVPLLVEDQHLHAGNSIILGANQSAGFIGPTVAGILIAGFSHSNLGVGLAFAIDAMSFAVSAVSLLLIRRIGRRQAPRSSSGKESIWVSILAGIKFLWSDQALRLMFVVVTLINFLFTGPLMIGIPVLADKYLRGGAATFGLLMSVLAGGSLTGYLLAGLLPRPGKKFMRIFLLAMLTAFGLCIGSLGFIRVTGVDFVIMLALGLGNGYITIIVLTWFQSRTPRDMIGRMMSLLMLTSTGVIPISQAIAGVVSKWSILGLFVSAGALILLVPLMIAGRPELKTFSESLAIVPVGERKN
jgi:MFS family permease